MIEIGDQELNEQLIRQAMNALPVHSFTQCRNVGSRMRILDITTRNYLLGFVSRQDIRTKAVKAGLPAHMQGYAGAVLDEKSVQSDELKIDELGNLTGTRTTLISDGYAPHTGAGRSARFNRSSTECDFDAEQEVYEVVQTRVDVEDIPFPQELQTAKSATLVYRGHLNGIPGRPDVVERLRPTFEQFQRGEQTLFSRTPRVDPNQVFVTLLEWPVVTVRYACADTSTHEAFFLGTNKRLFLSKIPDDPIRTGCKYAFWVLLLVLASLFLLTLERLPS